ncbi:hypothetical protein [Agrococcus sp. HG114]|uniref:hypothetical protein n=1 Tax=Agrococcus sp. HG114 TaxID=2969757 RepID=UPI00215B1889|nr:hypothetical protein [Agrococcus sp. HG114]MCR8671443.1 hypothetical protein [Agrococcus sp. HG114]
MNEWHEDRERLAAQVEDILAGWHESVERVPGDDGEPDTLVARDGDRVAAILPLDEESVEAMVDAEADGELAQWLREELAEDDDREDDDLDDEDDDDLEAAADAWLGDDDADDADADASTEAVDDDDDDYDWDDPEADALIDELPR